MSDNEGEEQPPRCEYVFEPEEHDVPSVVRSALTEEWRCPHYSKEEFDGEHLCLFHLPTSEKDANEVQNHFINCVTADGASVKRFVGGQFEGLHLINVVLESNDNNPVDLRYANFENRLDFTGSTISQPLFLTGAHIEGELRAPATKFQGLVFAQHMEIEGGILCTEARFNDRVNFRSSTFDEHTKFGKCRFEGEANFYGCEFNVDPDLPYDPKIKEANHRPQLVSFSSATFSENVNLNSTKFNDILYFERVTTGGTVHLDDIEFNEKSHTYMYVVPESDETPEKDRQGHHVAEISGDFPRLQISPDDIADEPCIISLQEANVESGSFSQPDSTSVYYDFSGATLGEVQFKEMNSKDSWEYLIFNSTNFEDVNFIDYRSALDESNYNLCNIYDPHDLFEELELIEKETTYLKARIGANNVHDRKSSAEFHIRELDNHRARLRKQSEWLSYFAYILYGVTSRYGETPGRVLAVFTPLLLISYWLSNSQQVPELLSGAFGLLFAVLPPIFSGLLVLASYRYIGN